MLFALSLLLFTPGHASDAAFLAQKTQEAQAEGVQFKKDLERIVQHTQKKSSCQSCQQTLILDKPPVRSSENRLIFVSHTMPLDALKALGTAAKIYNARLITRGLKERSFKKTAQWVKEIGYPVDIDPPLFQRYEITRVPTFVMVTATTAHRFRGNVPLSFVIEKMKALS